MQKNIKTGNDTWNTTQVSVFWGEIAPSDHVLQIYENDEDFITTLTGFVGTGINAGECSIVIATRAHLDLLEQKLRSHGLIIESLVEEFRYVPLDAEKTLERFMVNNWPDGKLFRQTITELFDLAKTKNRNVRAFGEMVALLWTQGHCGATVHLEALWNDFMHAQPFPLFCAYPKAGFTQEFTKSLEDICCSHSRMISSESNAAGEISYIDSNYRAAS